MKSCTYKARLYQARLYGRMGKYIRRWPTIKHNHTDACWVWTGAKAWRKETYGDVVLAEYQYGRISVHGKAKPAHRVMYELTKGGLPKGAKLWNTCGRYDCVRPDHWSLKCS